MTLWPWLIFTVVIGACVGSFINVVIWRLPRGESLVRPPSHCPSCNARLRWFENVPVVAWLYLRGRCRHCQAAISVQYPLVEAATASLFGVLFWAYYLSGLRPEFAAAGLAVTWPVLLVHLALVGALLAATVIDAKLFIIPLQVPWFVCVLALAVLPAASARLGSGEVDAMLPAVAGVRAVGAAAGGLLGLAVVNLLLWLGLLPRTFADDPTADAPLTADAPPAYPHARREVAKESVFLGVPLVLGVAGWWGVGLWWGGESVTADWVRVLSGVVLGYLVGGGVLWLTRIWGTLAFGKEAMGLGDVHLLAAVGAVLGATDAVAVFFLAPFLALLATLVISGVGRMLKGQVRIVPYGPYLAATAVLMMVLRQPIWQAVSDILYARS